MKRNKLLQIMVAILISTAQLSAQTITPDVQATDTWQLINRTATKITEEGKKGIRLSEGPNEGVMILKEYEFANGTIEMDIKGKNVVQQSFVGLVFHGIDSSTYDAIYFRPFNFINPDTSRRSRAVQYISMPNYPWEKLRQDFPGKYENRVAPVPNPDEWFHFKISISGKQIKVYVNNAAKPCLEVEKLTNSKTGGLALWVGNNSGAAFANLKITPLSNDKAEAKIPYGNNAEAGKYFNTGEVKLYYETYGTGKPILLLHGGVYGYISEFEHLIPKLAENNQVICPVLVMSGDKDDYSNVEMVVSCYKQIPKAMLSIIPGCGHVIFYCNFPAVWESLKGFVNS